MSGRSRVVALVAVVAVVASACGGGGGRGSRRTSSSTSPTSQAAGSSTAQPHGSAAGESGTAEGSAAPGATGRTPGAGAKDAAASGASPAASGTKVEDDEARAAGFQTLICAKQTYGKTTDYRLVTPQTLKACKPELDFVDDGQSTGPTVVSVKGPSQHEFRAAVRSRSGSCFALRDRAGPDNPRGAVTYSKTAGTSCRATSPPDSSYSAKGWI
ncbi:MAG TPA: hypothetical protein VNE62_11835 [Actinomycetota bacterium]|nr:hypothetical protein [Actinomycetota bacterium]